MAAKEVQHVVVVCPKCKTRLRVDDTKLSLQGSRFKCPKCSTVLVVKKPVVQAKKALDEKKILVAHSNPSVLESVRNLLEVRGYAVITCSDGIDAMVKTIKELPFFGVIEVALPKIFGFEVCKRLKTRSETKEMKFVLVPSIYDRSKYRREPESLYGADDYIEEHELSTKLIDAIKRLKSGESAESEKSQPQSKATVPPAPETRPAEKSAEAPLRKEAAAPAPKPAAEDKTDEFTEKAKRLARTIINDIYLYNAAKVDEAIRRGNFYAVFAAEVREGLKLYENRIPKETRSKADFYREAIDNFLSAKKTSLS